MHCRLHLAITDRGQTDRARSDNRAVERRRRRARLVTRRRRCQWVGEIPLLFALFVVAMIGALAFNLNPASASEHRSRAAREFQREHPCPSTGRTSGPCPGYWKDHIVPLACGGPDTLSNLQWQTIAGAKAKDRWERKTCVRWGNPALERN